MKIIIATDGSECSTVAVEKCCELLDLSNRNTIRIVSAFELQVPMATEPFAISADAYKRLDEFAEQNAQANVNKAAEIIKSRFPDTANHIETSGRLGRPAQIILEEAEGWGADLIVMGSHGRGFWGRLALGSVSSAVVHHAKCSVLVVRAKHH